MGEDAGTCSERVRGGHITRPWNGPNPLKMAADHELRRKVVLHKMGDAHARRDDAFIEGAFRSLARGLMDGSASVKPFAGAFNADTSLTPEMKGLLGGGEQPREAINDDLGHRADLTDAQRDTLARAHPHALQIGNKPRDP